MYANIYLCVEHRDTNTVVLESYTTQTRITKFVAEGQTKPYVGDWVVFDLFNDQMTVMPNWNGPE